MDVVSTTVSKVIWGVELFEVLGLAELLGTDDKDFWIGSFFPKEEYGDKKRLKSNKLEQIPKIIPRFIN